MIKRLEERAYWWLRVPSEPVPPAGAPGSLRTFRAGKNFLYLRMILWAGTQIGAAIGLVFSLYFIREIELEIELERMARIRDAQAAVEQAMIETGEVDPEMAAKVPAATENETDSAGTVPDIVAEAERSLGELTEEEQREAMRGTFHALLHRFAPGWLRELPSRVSGDALFWIKFGESIGIVVFTVQFFWSLLAGRIDYKQRWYMVTDRSLRLRWGVVRIQETTMSFANLQQVAVKQGPLERLLKIADVEVRSAGGGASESEEGGDDSMHRSVFRAVENASEIRDMILERLKHYRQAGLGEPDDANHAMRVADATAAADSSDALAAASEVLVEARALRAALRK